MNSCDVDKLANSEDALLQSSHDQSPRVNLKLTARNNEIYKKIFIEPTTIDIF